MNKIWLAVLLVPYMGFAQTNQEWDVDEEVLFSDESHASVAEDREESSKAVACRKNKGPYEKEPAYCAYCGSSLISRVEEAPAAMDSASPKVASADKAKSSSLKRRSSPSIGAKSSARSSKMKENANRPRVTQRKKEPLSSPLEQNQAQVSSSQTLPSSELSKRQETLPESDEQSVQIETKTTPKSSSRPKVMQRKQLSEAGQDVKSGRFSERNQKVASLKKQRPCAQAQKQDAVSKQGNKSPEKRGRAVAKKSSPGSKSQIRESMFFRSSQED